MGVAAHCYRMLSPGLHEKTNGREGGGGGCYKVEKLEKEKSNDAELIFIKHLAARSMCPLKQDGGEKSGNEIRTGLLKGGGTHILSNGKRGLTDSCSQTNHTRGRSKREEKVGDRGQNEKHSH